eukprot:CAMPEP_0197690320 /NCGR_PEP_ID=MMETSP1338-20131121/108191_1 /TAXON_ID=43686 ORGANISM="Pelagodinium beii, Strain RCC1491" /NCGR_SAMPLE_ID=MMETSP1338 /ASSEMBLY_ACC=CAM_ASM_000754 /LENGTH=143 /DNA_ID=CAMNT_0043272763 /DNA_START=36 /DNA_END=467 /DNA_ORIENTATION=+
MIRCWNPHLNLHLVKLEHGGGTIAEAWLIHTNVDQSVAASKTAEERSLAIVYNMNIEDDSGTMVLRPLRLEWGPEGLSFMEAGLGKDCVSMKVLNEPMSPELLIRQLQTLDKRMYDPVYFNSRHFCELLFSQVDGKEERSRKR